MRFQRTMRWFGKASGALGAGAAVLGLFPSGPGSVAAQDAGVQPVSAPPPAAAAQPQGLSESVVASVNDDMISSYDVIQRMRLLIVTSGIQPTEQNVPEIQREALR